MDRGGDPTLPPPAKSPKLSDTTTIAGGDPTLLPPAEFPKLSDTTAIESDTTTINSLGEDLLLAIFLHLHSLATLTRAAFTCRAWRRAVASSPAFRRRFRELHRAPLLGLVAEPHRDALPCFAPAPRRDRDVLAAIRGGDFSLTTLLDPDDWAGDAPLSWRIHDCKDGYLVLLNWDTGLLATVNPLTLQFTEYIEMPFNRNTGSSKPGCPISLDVHLIFSDEEPMSFRLVWLFHKDSEVQVAVFTSEQEIGSFTHG
ncbi:hypothetical protein PR202_ga10589 [Eleusine coracana subsp. coracana]|uniref:F-box domain-containing protein n=1 Tax=Eleusine coracana subsp. coracana TaxID=191504 RepID=A0AAV5C706_ELECO|nr:hypothetical protein PR202_ga10589 [Eleusine coracana subsp. coracana]